MDWQVFLWRWSNCPTQEWNHGLTYSLGELKRGSKTAGVWQKTERHSFQRVSTLENVPGWGRRVRGQDAGHSQGTGARRGPLCPMNRFGWTWRHGCTTLIHKTPWARCVAGILGLSFRKAPSLFFSFPSVFLRSGRSRHAQKKASSRRALATNICNCQSPGRLDSSLCVCFSRFWVSWHIFFSW